VFALDTNTVIYLFKGRGRVRSRVELLPPRLLAIPILVLYELEVGAAKSESPDRRKADLEQLLSVVRVLPFEAGEAKTAAAIRARLESLGNQIGPIDTLVAGIALHHGAVLVTNNVDEFSRVEGLSIENWL